MQAQNTNPKPTRQDLLDAWAAYKPPELLP